MRTQPIRYQYDAFIIISQRYMKIVSPKDDGFTIERQNMKSARQARTICMAHGFIRRENTPPAMETSSPNHSRLFTRESTGWPSPAPIRRYATATLNGVTKAALREITRSHIEEESYSRATATPGTSRRIGHAYKIEDMPCYYERASAKSCRGHAR